MSALPSSISDMSVAEKCELLDALWEDLESQPLTLNEEQTQELDLRTASYERNPSTVIPWEQIKARLTKQ